ncbi:MAG: Ig-like domain-containing protein [candidate division Zixibacteria bacterium]|nr:Ig-like domain-containing protein [candidate division Zixibacteria bacterium]
MVRRLLRQAFLITASLILAAGNYLYAGESGAGTQSPEWATIRTACNRIILNNAGNIGHQGNEGQGGFNLNFFDDCDTTDNVVGADDNAAIYLYDASPFLLRVKGNNPGDTILNSYIFDADWQNRGGFLPTSPMVVDSSNPDFQYVFTGRFITPDSAIGVECEYWMPLHPDTCGMLIQRMKIVNRKAAAINNLMVGELMDWNIPSDSGVENGSDYDATRQLMWCYGGEYGPDSIVNNDCVPADYRAGGFAYLNGYKLPAYGSSDRFGFITGMFTGMNADWIAPTGNWIPQQLYNKLNTYSGFQYWQSTNPTMEDSLYQDLSLVAYFGKKNLGVNDTLVFIKVLAPEYNGGSAALKITVDKAKKWWKNRFNNAPVVLDPGIKTGDPNQLLTFTVSSFDLDGDPITLTATGLPGSSTFTDNGNGSGTFNWIPLAGGNYTFTVNADDGQAIGSRVIQIIVFNSTCCVRVGDANHNNIVNIQDVTYLINFLYKHGPMPPCRSGTSMYPEADANCNCVVNVQDVTCMINILYHSGMFCPSCTCQEWEQKCLGN